MIAPRRLSFRSLIAAGVAALALLAGQGAAAQPATWSDIPAPGTPPASLAPGRPAFLAPRDYPLMAASQPASLAASSVDGGLWFAASGLSALGKLDRTTGAVTYYPLGIGARPFSIAEAPDRTLYAADRALNVLHRLNPESGEATRIAMPPDTPFLDLASLRVDIDGKIWFSGASGWLGSHDPKTGVTDVSSHDDLQGLAGGAKAPNGAIWFVAGKSARMIRIDPQRARFDSAALPADLVGVRGIAAGPQGEVWIAATKPPSLSRYSGRGTWITARLPWPDSRPQALVIRPDGSVICADAGRRKLIRYRPGLERFDEVGDLGAGGNIRAMIDLGDAIAIADMAADRIRIFPDDTPKEN